MREPESPWPGPHGAPRRAHGGVDEGRRSERSLEVRWPCPRKRALVGLLGELPEDAPFQAYFSSDSASVFTVTPGHGVLTRAGTGGTLFTVSYTPVEYGKPVKGRLIVLTDEMQWSYAVRGTHPKYTAPRGEAQVETVLDATVARGLGGSPTKNS